MTPGIKYSDLEEIIGEWNCKWFEALARAHGINFKLIEGLHGHTRAAPRFTGELSDSLAEIEIAPSQSKHAVAVGAIIDDEGCREGAPELPVVVAIGINYWQISGGKLPLKDWTKTGMKKRISDILKNDLIIEGKFITDFHLVVVNFFPWITTKSWSDLHRNTLAEALFLYKWGVPDATGLVAALITALYQRIAAGGHALSHVVFHGVSCAVPTMSLEITKRFPRNGPKPAFIGCDNLGWPNRKNLEVFD